MTAKIGEAAFLVLPTMRPRRHSTNSWLTSNIGAQVIKRELEAAGATIGECSPSTAGEWAVVLVSLTSYHDVIVFWTAVHARPDWRLGRRKFRVIAGGYGMQNPLAVREYIDIAVFGRAEATAPAILTAALRREMPALTQCADPMNWGPPVEVRQAAELYPAALPDYDEQFVGCPLKCKFCHYTFARKHIGSDHAYSKVNGTAGAYVLASDHRPRSMEVTWPQLMNWPHDRMPSRLIAGVDGWSEPLRFTYGKRIADWEITEGLERLAKKASEFGRQFIRVVIYQIDGFPGETPADRKIFERALRRVAPPPEGIRIFVNVEITPFRAAPLTPMLWEAYSNQNATALRMVNIANRDGRATAQYGEYMETPWSVMLAAITERHDGSPGDDAAFAAALRARELQRGGWRYKMQTFAANFDAEKYMGEYEIGAPMATSPLYSFVDNAGLAAIATKMRADVAEGMPLRGARTICGNPIKKPLAEFSINAKSAKP